MYHLNLIKAGETAEGQRESRWNKYIPYLHIPCLAVLIWAGVETYLVRNEVRELWKKIEILADEQVRIAKKLAFLLDNLPDDGKLTEERRNHRRDLAEILGESPENLQGTRERYHMELHIIQPEN